MTFQQHALQIQTEIQNLPLENLGFEALESKHQSSVRISQLIQERAQGLDFQTRDRMIAEFEGMGPISPLLEDEEITEIIVNSLDEIWFEKDGKLKKHLDQFISPLTFKNFIDRICSEARVQISIERPFCDGKFRNFRLHLATQEICKNSHTLSLRRQSQKPWSFDRLLRCGWAPEKAFCILEQWLAQKKTFLVVGETGSGKTSVLNSCLSELPENERLVILEDTSELVLPNSASSKMLTRFDSNGVLPDVSLTDLVRQSLRMRPDRLVVGEVRGSEAKDLLLALSTGHQGSFGTLHASSAAQALMRLEMLVQLGAPQWNLTTIRRLIGLSLQGIVVVGRDPCGKRRLNGLYEITGVEDTGILLDCRYSYQF
jgi:pilus assembly protein CpaF